jgi:hypothetical protein
MEAAQAQPGTPSPSCATHALTHVSHMCCACAQTNS